MNHNTANTTQAMDGFDVWFFGGTPGPDDHPHNFTLTEADTSSFDEEDDARIACFAHHCHCGQPAAASRQAAKAPVLTRHFQLA